MEEEEEEEVKENGGGGGGNRVIGLYFLTFSYMASKSQKFAKQCQ